MAGISQLRLRRTAMGNDEIRPCRGELIGCLGRRNATGDAEADLVGAAQELDLAVNPKIEGVEDAAQLAVDHRYRRQIDHTTNAGTAQRLEHIVTTPERIDAEHPGKNAILPPRRLADGGQQIGVGVVPCKATDPKGKRCIQAGKERAQYHGSAIGARRRPRGDQARPRLLNFTPLPHAPAFRAALALIAWEWRANQQRLATGREMPRAYVCGTFDTKGPELGFIAARLRDLGVATCTVDVSTRPHETPCDVSAAEVAGHHPQGATVVLGLQDRGAAVAAMSLAFEHFTASRDDIAGMIGAGGSGGTALLAPAMRALPVGVPKVLVSTIASGNVAAYVGASDLWLVPSMTDVQGLNRISRRLLGNAAHALAGMIRFGQTDETTRQRPAIGLTMFGVTTICVQTVCAALEQTHDCIVFHAVGTGGQAMEKLIASGLLTGALDITTTEVCDLLMGGIFPADETRFDAIIRSRIPYVLSCGALDMVNFGPLESVPARYQGRKLYVHNPQVTLMRTTAEDNVRMAEWIAAKVNRMDGPVRLLIPEGGVSAHDVPGQAFHDPIADQALFDTLSRLIVTTASRRVIRLPWAINDPAFAAALVAAFHEIAG